jgi:hypothetical protein
MRDFDTTLRRVHAAPAQQPGANSTGANVTGAPREPSPHNAGSPGGPRRHKAPRTKPTRASGHKPRKHQPKHEPRHEH